VTAGLIIAVALVAGITSLLLARRWPRSAIGIGLVGAAACLVVTVAMGDHEPIAIDGLGIALGGDARLVALAWSAATLLGGVVGWLTGAAAATIGASLVGLAGAMLALAGDDAALAFAALTAGAVPAVLIPVAGSPSPDRDVAPAVVVARRALTAVVGAGLAAVLVVAWARSSLGPLGLEAQIGGDRSGVAPGMAWLVLGVASLVVIRGGGIPAHLWAARLVGAVSALAVPAALAWGSTAFVLVALSWTDSAVTATAFAMDDVGRLIVVLLALASIGLGGLAAVLHDDIEHVLGYSIVQDLGVVLLAFVAMRPDTNAAARDWLIASAALKSAFAAWVAMTRWAFGAHRVSELRGWARRSPGLAAALAVIVLGSVGLPGMALFEARVTLATSVLPGVLGYLVLAVALSPLVALGRIAVGGLERPSPEVDVAPRERLGVLVLPPGGWSRGGWTPGGIAWAIRTGRAAVPENGAIAAVLSVAVLAVLGLALAIGGV
jgi:NADH-quinone oxidoreductase subunit N